jgi:hypothetical protein
VKPADLARPLDTGVSEAETLRVVQDASEQYQAAVQERFPALARRRKSAR